jgi:hypothetical protein
VGGDVPAEGVLVCDPLAPGRYTIGLEDGPPLAEVEVGSEPAEIRFP